MKSRRRIKAQELPIKKKKVRVYPPLLNSAAQKLFLEAGRYRGCIYR